jgi:hypothetical protein
MNHNHVIDSWIAQLALGAGWRRLDRAPAGS